MRETTINVQLFNEGISVSRPVKAQEINAENKIFRIPDKSIEPESEEWEFKPGEVVKCIEFQGEKKHSF